MWGRLRSKQLLELHQTLFSPPSIRKKAVWPRETTLSVECTHCGALKFPQETESLCCLKGNVQLEAFPQSQSFLRHLYEGTNTAGKHFLASIRKYNSAFQMTSFGCNEITMAGFNPSFRVQGQVYHRTKSSLSSYR